MDEFFFLTLAFFCFMSYLLYSLYQLVERLVVQLEREIQHPPKTVKKIPPPPPPIPDDWFASHPLWDEWFDKEHSNPTLQPEIPPEEVKV